MESGVPRLSESDTVVNEDDDSDVEADAGERGWRWEMETPFTAYPEEEELALLRKSLGAFELIELDFPMV